MADSRGVGGEYDMLALSREYTHCLLLHNVKRPPTAKRFLTCLIPLLRGHLHTCVVCMHLLVVVHLSQIRCCVRICYRTQPTDHLANIISLRRHLYKASPMYKSLVMRAIKIITCGSSFLNIF